MEPLSTGETSSGSLVRLSMADAYAVTLPVAEVTSTTGKVTAYASVVDNLTNDPLLVSPVVKGAVTANRYTIPGVADLNNGFASWRTDMRLFNSGASSTTATLTYYPQGAPNAPLSTDVTIAAGE